MCNICGKPVEGYPVELIDDGTLDTVFKCTNCRKEMRFNPDIDFEENECVIRLIELGIKVVEKGTDIEVDPENIPTREKWIENQLESIREYHVCFDPDSEY